MCTSWPDADNDITLGVVASFDVTVDNSLLFVGRRLGDKYHSLVVNLCRRHLFVVRFARVGHRAGVEVDAAGGCVDLKQVGLAGARHVGYL